MLSVTCLCNNLRFNVIKETIYKNIAFLTFCVEVAWEGYKVLGWLHMQIVNLTSNVTASSPEQKVCD